MHAHIFGAQATVTSFNIRVFGSDSNWLCIDNKIRGLKIFQGAPGAVSFHTPGALLYDPGVHGVQLEADEAPAKVNASTSSQSSATKPNYIGLCAGLNLQQSSTN